MDDWKLLENEKPPMGDLCTVKREDENMNVILAYYRGPYWELYNKLNPNGILTSVLSSPTDQWIGLESFRKKEVNDE